MNTVWALRREELLSDCLVSPDVFHQMVDRLGAFVMPYQHVLETEAGQRNVHLYLQGLLSHLPGKNAEDIATFVDIERQVMQAFMGTAPWDHRPLIHVLVDEVADQLGEPDGIIAFDPSSFPKRGTHSVGVKRQWCSHRGKVDNCQVGVFMGYVSRHDHVLLDQMHEAVTRMNAENFLVRPHRRYVETFSSRERWQGLSPTDHADIAEHLASLPYPDEDEEFARRFDLLLLNLQLALLEKSPSWTRYQEQVRALAAGLEEKRTIPAVHAQMALILDLQTDDYWQDITVPMLERVRRTLRDLIRFIDKDGQREKVYTDFEDELGAVTEISNLIRPSPSLHNYRLK